MIWSLQALRFVAALMVVYVHAAQTAAEVTSSLGSSPLSLVGSGLAGVDIFFVVSGFIIAKVAPGRHPVEFLWSRVVRVVPIYLIFALPQVAISVVGGTFGWREAFATFLFWPATDQMTAPSLEVGWTLCFEMLFYAAAGLVLAGRRWVYLLLGAYGVAFILRPASPVFQFLGNPLILEFMFGVAIAYLPRWRRGTWALMFGIALLIGIGLLGAIPFGGALDFLVGSKDIVGRDGLYRVLVFGVPAALIVYGTVHIEARGSVWTYLGDASYSLYLSHPLLLAELQRIWMSFPAPPDIIIAVGVAASVTFAWRVHELIEKPTLSAMRRLRPTQYGAAGIKVLQEGG